MTYSSVGKLIIPVCDNCVAKMRTRRGRGALGSVLLFMQIALDYESPKVNRHAATKVVCLVVVPMSP